MPAAEAAAVSAETPAPKAAAVFEPLPFLEGVFVFVPEEDPLLPPPLEVLAVTVTFAVALTSG